MRTFISILFITLPLFAAETVTISAHNWGPDSAAHDAAIGKHFADFADAVNATGDVYWLHQYEYTLTDSAIGIIDLSQVDPRMVKRFFDPTKPEPVECAVSPIWATLSRHSPAKVTYAKYTGWKGGPEPTKVKPLTGKQYEHMLTMCAKKRVEVDQLIASVKEWQKVNGKKPTAKEKRSGAWKVVTGKVKESEVIKEKNKIGGKI